MKKLLFLLLLFVVQACGKDDCEDYACTTPPDPFVFEIVDKATGENLFSNGTFSPEQIAVINTIDGREVEFTFVEENGLNLLRVHGVGWKTETVLSSIQLDGEEIFTLYVEAEMVSENCCTFTRYHKIEIEGVEYKLNEETGTYTIFVE